MNRFKKYRAVIIEPSEIIREGIKLLLEKSPAFQVTACFPDLQSFEDKRIKEDFQLILFNPAITGFYKPIPVRSLFSGYPDVCLIAVLYQYVDAETLQHFDGIVDIYDEGWTIPQKIIRIIETEQQENSRAVENIELSDREKDTLIALAKGFTNKEIAEKLHISTHTVISHRKNIVRKTGIKTVSGLTLYALFNNLISQEELTRVES